MKNWEKAAEIADNNKCYFVVVGRDFPEDSYQECEASALEMANWKDEQFKAAIQEVRSDYMCLDHRCDGAICALDSVLKILNLR